MQSKVADNIDGRFTENDRAVIGSASCDVKNDEVTATFVRSRRQAAPCPTAGAQFGSGEELNRHRIRFESLTTDPFESCLRELCSESDMITGVGAGNTLVFSPLTAATRFADPHHLR